MIRLKEISIEYDRMIVEPCDVLIPEGKITLFTGESGSGKSSLLYRIGLLCDIECEYLIDDLVVSSLKEKEIGKLRKEKFSFVMQDSSLFEQYDVIGNLKLYSSINDQNHTDQEYEDLLRLVRLHIDLHQKIETLSGGEKQRLAIACALCKNTDTLILDEPTAFLDGENEQIVFSVLKDISDRLHKTIILASHSAASHDIADQIYTIKERKLIEVRHSEEENIIENQDHKKIGLTFYVNYLKYFMRKYYKTERTMIIFMSVMLVIMNVLLMYGKNMTDQSVGSFEALSSNQIFMTEDSEHIHVDEQLTPFTIEEGEWIPYVETYAQIAGLQVTVLPFYNYDKLAPSIMKDEKSEKIFFSYGLYNMLVQNANLQEDIIFLVRNANGEIVETDDVHHYGGLMKKDHITHYLNNNENYMYVDYEILKDIYQKMNVDQLSAYIGYTKVCDSFESYRKECERLKDSGHGINLFFESFEEIEELRKTGYTVRYVTVFIVIVLSSLLFGLLQLQYYHRREKEFLLLKVNGTDHTHHVLMTVAESAIQMIVSVAIACPILLIIAKYFNFDSSGILKITVIFITVMLTVTAFMNTYCIRKLSMVSLRQEI